MKIFDDKKILLLDGAMGTELQRRGIKTELPLWSAKALIDSPQTVTEVHKAYIDAGADIITTNTFRTQRTALAKVGLGNKVFHYTKIACDCAKEAVKESDRKVLIAGSMAPLEDCYEPGLVPADDILYSVHKEHAEALMAGGVDFIIIETMNCIREAKVAAEIVHGQGIGFIVSFVCNSNGLLSGETIWEAVKAITPFEPMAVALNCSSPEIINKHLPSLLDCSPFPVGVYGNGAGEPDDKYGWKFAENMNPDQFKLFAKEAIKLGVRFIGGCCGTNPEYIRPVKEMLIKKES